jgi:hypothetical protein
MGALGEPTSLKFFIGAAAAVNALGVAEVCFVAGVGA